MNYSASVYTETKSKLPNSFSLSLVHVFIGLRVKQRDITGTQLGSYEPESMLRYCFHKIIRKDYTDQLYAFWAWAYMKRSAITTSRPIL